MNSNIQYQKKKLNCSEVLLNKYKGFPMRLYFITEIVLIEGRILFFKSEETIVSKVRLSKEFADLESAMKENKIMVMP